MDNTTQPKPNSIDEKIIPNFSGPSTKGGKIFKATPHLINLHTNMLLRSNIIIILVFLCILVGGLFISVISTDKNNDSLQYIGNFLTFFSFIMIIVLSISIPHSISSYNYKMSKIYLEVAPHGINGITINDDNDYIFFDIPYKKITRIVYNSKQITIYTTDGYFYNYDTFYNPREIYSTIIDMSDDKINLKFQTS